MWIKSLELENCFQHGRLSCRFDGNLIGIVGPNGSGKSNLLNAIMFGMCGFVPDKDKSEILSDGAEEGHVRMEVEFDGKILTVHRDLASAKAWLEHDGGKLQGVTAVNARLSELMGMDRDLLRQAVFVRQAELDSILFLEPAVRERAWLRLVGLAEAVKIYTRLGPVLGLVPEFTNYADSVNMNIELLKQDRARLRELRAEYRANVLECPAASYPDRKDLVALRDILLADIRQCEKAAQLSRRVDEDAAGIAALDAERSRCDARLETWRKELPEDIPGYLTELGVKTAGLRKSAGAIRAGRTLEDGIRKAEADLAALKDPALIEQDILRLSDELYKATAAVSAAEGAHKVHQTMLKAAHSVGLSGTTCPLCLQPVADPTGMMARLEEEIAKCNGVLAQVKPAADHLAMTMGRLRSERTSVQLNKQTLEQKLAGWRTDLACLHGDATAQGADPDQLDYQAAALDKGAVNIRLVAGHVRTDEKAVADIDLKLRTLHTDKGLAMQELGAMPPGLASGRWSAAGRTDDAQAQLKMLDGSLVSLSELERMRNYLGSARAEAMRNARTRVKLIKDLKRKDGMQDLNRSVRRTAEQVRDWFHHSKGPHGAVMSVLGQLTPDVNRFLSDLSSPFSVVPDGDQLMFRYVKNGGPVLADGKYPAATRLSGGEKVVLAMSFRLASYCMFAAKLGLLALDEPTVYLDDSNVEKMCHWMEKLGEIARRLRVQILISTHERTIIPMMDTVLDLSKPQTT